MRFSKIALLLALFVQLGMFTAALGQTILYSESFENNNWGIFEEIVSGNACYDDSIGAVETSNEFAFVGAKSLRVWANKAQSNYSNHVLANHQLYSNGVTGTYRYGLRAYMPANTWHGQTGPEWSLQTTKGPQNLTYIAGIQYIRNPWVPDKWNIWHNGTWVTIPSNVFNLQLAADTWYLLELDFDLIHNQYLSMHIAGNGTDTILNLQQNFANAPNGYQIIGENRGFAPSTWLTLESENLWTGCSFATEQKVYYDDAVLVECPNHPVVFAGSNQAICPGGTATLQVSANGGNLAYSYLWSNGNNSATQTVAPVANTIYGVTVTDANGCTGSDEVLVTILNLPSISPAPTNVVATDGWYADHVLVTWSASACYYYQVFRNTVNNKSTATPLGNWVQSAQYQDFTALPGIQYYYWIKAAHDAMGNGVGAASAGNGGYIALLPPNNVQATDGSSTARVTVTWTGSTGLRYRVYRHETNNPNAATALGSGWNSSTTFHDNTALSGQTYYYWVKASKYTTGALASTFSANDAGFRGVVPTVPVNVDASDGLFADRVQVSWNGTAGVYFQVFRSTVNSKASASPINTWSAVMTFADVAANPGTTYYYWIKSASNSAGANATALSAVNSGFRSNMLRGVSHENQRAAYASLFPNPATDQVTLVWEAKMAGNCTISCLDAAGKIVLSGTMWAEKGHNTHSFDIAALSEGVYTMELKSSGQRCLLERLIVLKK